MAKETTTKEKEAVALNGKELRGVIVSDKMDKTVVVEVQRYFKHPKYQKFIKEKKRYKAHDEENTYKTGDKVTLQETKPIAKGKHFVVSGVQVLGNATNK
jgi:small subunit ribosomal protein S17